MLQFILQYISINSNVHCVSRRKSRIREIFRSLNFPKIRESFPYREDKKLSSGNFQKEDLKNLNNDLVRTISHS